MTTQIDTGPFLQLDRIIKIQERLFDYSRIFGGRFPEDDEEHAKYLIEKYAFCTSVLIGILGDDVPGKRILEVGPGYAGEFMLDFLVEEGADAIGIDPCFDYNDYSGPSKGRYKLSAMEDLSRSFDSSSVDLINIMSMHPDPIPSHIRRWRLFGNFFQRLKANRYYKKYQPNVAKEIDKVLKPNGYFLLWSRPYNEDFRLNSTHLNKMGFSHQTIRIPRDIMPVDFDIDIYNK